MTNLNVTSIFTRWQSVDYVDLLLLAWNGGTNESDPNNKRIYKAWKGLEALYKSGAAHASGIVDFYCLVSPPIPLKVQQNQEIMFCL